MMGVLLLLAIGVAAFGLMWWGMRDVEPTGDGPRENVDVANSDIGMSTGHDSSPD